MLHLVKPPETKPTLSAGEVLPDEIDGTRFEVHEMIGRGGMGEVFRATRLSDGAPCAVKCVRGDLVNNPSILLRTRFEAQAFRRIIHDHVVHVFGTGVRADNVPWMAMEWLDGFTLAEILERRGRIPLRWAIQIVRDLCRGLHAIHEHAVHRDVKPANVHLGLDAVTRVLDLGAAKSKEANVHLTTTGFQVGTFPYMAPEQLENSLEVDARADVWGASIVLFMLITGVHPFARFGALPASQIELGWRIMRDPHLPLSLMLPSAPPFFGQIIDRGLAKARGDRHRSAEELATVLTAALDYLEKNTGHAEPLSSLIAQLEEPAPAEPPRLLWTPRTTSPMQPAAGRPWPRTTAPMPAPTPAAAKKEEEERADMSAPAVQHDWPALPLPPAPTDPTEEAPAGEETGDRHSDVRLREIFKARPAQPPAAAEPSPEARPPAAPPAPAEPSPVSERAPPREERREEEEDEPLPERRREGSAGRWLWAASLFGGPRWLVLLMSTSAVVTTCESLYFFVPWPHATKPPSGPIVVPVAPTPEPPDEPAPGATPSATASAAPPEPAVTARAPSLLPRAKAAPRRPPAPAPPPPPTATSHRIFGSEN